MTAQEPGPVRPWTTAVDGCETNLAVATALKVPASTPGTVEWVPTIVEGVTVGHRTTLHLRCADGSSSLTLQGESRDKTRYVQFRLARPDVGADATVSTRVSERPVVRLCVDPAHSNDDCPVHWHLYTDVGGRDRHQETVVPCPHDVGIEALFWEVVARDLNIVQLEEPWTPSTT